MKDVLLLSAFALGLFFVGLMGVGYYFSEKVLVPRKLTYADSIKKEREKNDREIKIFEEMEKLEVFLDSLNGYKLHGFLVASGTEERVVVLNHGITQTLAGVAKFVRFYRELGFAVLLHDFTGHGDSGGKLVTFGVREKEDLSLWIQWLKKTHDYKYIGMHGESMGSSIGLEYVELKGDLDFLVSDCAFSDLREILIYRMKWDFHVPLFPILYFTEFWIWARIGARFRDISPLRSVTKAELPIFFIHGLEDRYTPFTMTERLYEMKSGWKRLWLVPGARHIGAYNTEKEKYEKEVKLFLLEIGVL